MKITKIEYFHFGFRGRIKNKILAPKLDCKF